MVVERPGTVDQEEPGLRRPACGDRERPLEDTDHLPHFAFGGGDTPPAQRPARRARYWRPGGQVQDVVPFAGEFAAFCWRDNLPGAGGQDAAGSWRASLRELAIQGRSQRAGQNAVPQLVVIGCRSKERVSNHVPIVRLDTSIRK